MKLFKRVFLSILCVVLLVGVAGCAPKENKNDQLSRGLFDMVLQEEVFDYLEPNPPIKYGDGLGGDIAKLSNTGSYTAQTKMRVSNVNFDPSMDSQINGQSITLDTAYNMPDGQSLVSFEGGGLNGQLALNKNELFLDIPMLLAGQAAVYAFDSKLNFNKSIPMSDRINDLVQAISQEQSGQDGTDEIDLSSLKDIRNNFVKAVAKGLDKEKIERTETSMMVFGIAEKVDELSTELNRDDIIKLAKALLEHAREDGKLLDLIVELSMNAPDEGYYELTADDIRNNFIESIDSLLENIESPYFFPENIQLDLTLYFRKPAFLSRMKPEPIAIKMQADIEGSPIDLFIKKVNEGRQFDLEVLLQSPFADFELRLTNQKAKDSYVMQGTAILPMDYGNLDIRGETIPSKGKETGNYTFTLNASDELSQMGFDSGVLTVKSEVTELKKSSEYEQKMTFDLDVDFMGQNMGGRLDIESLLKFSKSVDINMPDFSGATRFESFDDLLESFN